MMKKALPVVLFAATVLLANWLTTQYGMVSVGFGLTATAGTFAAGLSFGVRDWCQEVAGRHGAVLAVLIGAALSWILGDGRIAVASAVAFLISEMVDLGVYTPLRSRDKYAAVVASNTVGSAVDTVIFLSIAGFPLTSGSFWGQMIGKGWMTLLAVGLLAAWTTRRDALLRDGI